MAEWESFRHWVDTILDLLRFGASFLRRQKNPTSTNDVEPVSERAKAHNPTEIDEISHEVIRIERVELTVKRHTFHRESPSQKTERYIQLPSIVITPFAVAEPRIPSLQKKT